MERFKRPVVSVVRCPDYDINRVRKEISRLLTPLGGMEAFIGKGDRVLIKPNLLKASLPEKAVTTHPAVVEAVAEEVKKAGGIPLVGDSPGIGNMKRIFEATGMTGVSERTGTRLVEFNESIEVETGEDAIFKNLEIAAEARSADRVISIPKVKTHAQMYVTLGVKNCFGCVVGKRKAQWHFKAGVTRDSFADLLIDVYRTVDPVLTIADGIVGMEGNGPGSGDPREIGLLFASADALAMDRVIVEALGLRADNVPLFRAAKRRGMAGTEMEEIEIRGDGLSGSGVRGFRPAAMVDLMFGPPFLRRYFKDAVTAKPRIDHGECTLCSDCIRTCPARVMKIYRGEVVIDHRNCIHCFCCQEVCPEGAITPKQGWLLRLVGGKG